MSLTRFGRQSHTSVATGVSARSNRAGSIRRVIRRADIFICGLCREHYDNEGEAFSCLQRCWQEFLTLSPVIARTRVLSKVYRCRFCARDHGQYREAEACARDCRAKQKALHEKEMSSFDLSLLPDKPRPKIKPKIALTMVRPMPRSSIPVPTSEADKAALAAAGLLEEQNKKAAEVTTVEADAVSQSKAAEAEEAAKKARAPKAGGPLEPLGTPESRLPRNSEKFYRDNAKYACSSCNKRYFTRSEVEQCFDSHAAGGAPA